MLELTTRKKKDGRVKSIKKGFKPKTHKGIGLKKRREERKKPSLSKSQNQKGVQ